MKSWFHILIESNTIQNLESKIDAPFIQLDADHKDDTISIIVSLDKKETFPQGYFQNSRYGHFLYNAISGTLEMIRRRFTMSKFRKTKVSNVDDAAKKIQNWLSENKNVES